MKIKLELEDFKFATTNWKYGSIRWLVVHIGGKPFSVCRDLEPSLRLGDSDKFVDFVDRHLVEKMEGMIKQILEDACAAIPPGTEITQKET